MGQVHLRRKGDQLCIERREAGWLYGSVAQGRHKGALGALENRGTEHAASSAGTFGWFSDEVLTKPPLPQSYSAATAAAPKNLPWTGIEHVPVCFQNVFVLAQPDLFLAILCYFAH